MPQLYVLAPVEFNSVAPSCDCVAHRFGIAADHPERVRRYPSRLERQQRLRPTPMTGPNSFGHTGRGGSLEFADREHGLAFGYAMNHIIGPCRCACVVAGC